MTLTMTGFGVTKQFLAEKKKDAFLGLQEKIEKRLRTSVTNATVDATGPVYFVVLPLILSVIQRKNGKVLKMACFIYHYLC